MDRNIRPIRRDDHKDDHFSKLPGEMQNAIVRAAVVESEPIYLDFARQSRGSESEGRLYPGHPTLARVNSEMHHVATSIYLAENTFALHSSPNRLAEMIRPLERYFGSFSAKIDHFVIDSILGARFRRENATEGIMIPIKLSLCKRGNSVNVNFHPGSFDARLILSATGNRGDVLPLCRCAILEAATVAAKPSATDGSSAVLCVLARLAALFEQRIGRGWVPLVKQICENCGKWEIAKR